MLYLLIFSFHLDPGSLQQSFGRVYIQRADDDNLAAVSYKENHRKCIKQDRQNFEAGISVRHGDHKKFSAGLVF
jgi:hypothetical protein